MGKVVDLKGNPVAASTLWETAQDFSCKDIQDIIDHISWLNREGQCAGLIVGILHTNGEKTKTYALDYDTNPDSVLGFLDRIKDLVKRDLVQK